MSMPPVLDPLAAYALWAPHYPAHAHNPVMQAEERAMLELMPAELAGLTVLDAGCGSGRYMRHALRRGASRVAGVDLSPAMLRCAADQPCAGAPLQLAQARLTALPLADGFSDVTVCGLVIGHLEALGPALSELRRVTRPGGTLLLSDIHPIGPALGWLRDFKAGGQRYSVSHTQHLYSHWHAACAALDLAIEEVREPMLDTTRIPDGAHFDPLALEVPVALVFRLRRRPRPSTVTVP